MRIGIVTLPLINNYGGIMQAYALQTVLRRMGHQVVNLEWLYPHPVPQSKVPITYLKGLARTILRMPVIPRFIRKHLDVSMIYTDEFIHRYIRTKYCNVNQEFKETDFDALIAGSDQVWSYDYSTKMMGGPERAFFAFAKDWKSVKRLAYAASFGQEAWKYPKTETENCTRLIQLFQAVSVREQSGEKLCKENLHYEGAVCVLDPTMLLKAPDYASLFKGIDYKSPGGLMVYLLDETPANLVLIEKVASSFSLTSFRANSRVESSDASEEQRVQPPVEHWLKGFHDSEFIVTDSFHACVFSILFRKPFLAILNKNRGAARMQSLLSMLGLEDRMVDGTGTIDIKSLKNIDYDEVHSKLDSLRKSSLNFLVSNLNQK